MTDRPTYTEPSEQRSKEEGGEYLPLRKILDGTNVSLNEFTDPMATVTPTSTPTPTPTPTPQNASLISHPNLSFSPSNILKSPSRSLASENCSIVGTKKDYPEEHASSESPGKEERTMNDDETGNDVKDGKGAIASENGEEKTEKKNKTDTRRVKFSLGEETTIFPSPEEIEQEQQQQQEDSNVQGEEIAMKEFLYYCSVHLVAYGICILIVVTTIVAGYCLTY
ncbi:hypothetical protein HZH66_013723 [Vespula vulgaris]|uniref:Uncharacterized protein n=1 Tax=Vespula vulgaris TaxID=7454 RepID=A0A834J6G3_VESVU|nr:hypothetical protein HZH66_013723 [Vespula vulgaris]